MKKKIIIFLVWIALTVFYCWNLSDIGRSMGANTNSAIEKYSEMMVEYGGTTTDINHLGSAMTDMWSYKNFDNLSKEFKFDFTVVGVSTVIYIFLTIVCYHQAFSQKAVITKLLNSDDFKRELFNDMLDQAKDEEKRTQRNPFEV